MDRLPLVRMTKTRSSSLTNRYILRQTFTWSNPAFDLESDAITRPSSVTIPRQYVTVPREETGLWRGLAWMFLIIHAASRHESCLHRWSEVPGAGTQEPSN